MTRRPLTSLLLLVAVLHPAPGCDTPPGGKQSDSDASQLLTGKVIGRVTQLQLREELKDFSDRFKHTIGSAANELQTSSSDPATCVRAVYWQLFTIPYVQRSAVSQNPVAALVDIWAFCKQLLDYFEKTGFGEGTELALRVSAQLEDDISTIGRELVPEQYFEEVETAVDRFVAENPISGSFSRRTLRPAMVKASDAKSLLWVTELPLAPFRMFMDDTAKSIREFTLVADSLVTYAQTLPDVFRWQFQLLLYDFEARPTTVSVVESFKTTSEGIESLAAMADKLPGDLRRELTTTLDAVEAKQAGLRETLKEVRTTLATADETLTGARTVAASLEKVTENWNEAGQRWTTAVGAAEVLVSKFTDEDQPADSSAPATSGSGEEHGFDIKDYTETAVRVEAAVAEARGLLESDAAAAFITRVVWSGVLLIVVFFASLLLYRVGVSRLGRAAPGGASDPASGDSQSRSQEGRLHRSR